MYNNAYVSMVLPAAGSGMRMKRSEKKQYININGREVLEWTIYHLSMNNSIDEFIVVVGKEEIEIVSAKISKWFPKLNVHVIEGGCSRDESVYLGLLRCDVSSEYVFIHDAVRPFVQSDWLDNMLAVIERDGFQGVALGKPLADTLKRVSAEGVILDHVDRTDLWRIETPQLFKTKAIKEAHSKKDQIGVLITDDTQLISALGGNVKIIAHEGLNEKITTPEELALAYAFLNELEKGDQK